MKKSALVSLALLLATAAMAEDINRTLDADENARVSVSNLAGSVEVSAWNRNRVEVTGTIGEDVEDFIFERDGSDVTIKVKAPNRSWGRKRVSSELDIRVPQNSSLNITTVSADIDVSGVRGEQKLQSVSGDIRTGAFAAEISAQSVSGDVDVEGNGRDSDWNLSSVSGDVTAENLSGNIAAEVVNGDIDIRQGAFDRIELKTVNGDIDFNATLRNGGKMAAKSVNGSVDVRFAGAVSARFEVETFKGRIRNCFGPKAERTSRHGPGWELLFTEGAGEGRVSIATLNGSLNLCKE